MTSKIRSDKDVKLAVVTGATGTIGRAIALELANRYGYALVLPCRDQHRGEEVVSRIRAESANPSVEFVSVDLSRKRSIQALAAAIPRPVDLLINNAATAVRQRTETAEGIELQFATNVLGYFWMIQAFADHLRAAQAARVVNVASYWAGGLDIDDPEFKIRRYDNGAAYRQSKQANRMLSCAFARRMGGSGLTVNACHPGDVSSRLSNELGFVGHESAATAAETPVWLATSPEIELENGAYFEHRRHRQCTFCDDHKLVERLFELCGSY